MDERLRQNRDRWDELVPHHLRSEFYDVDGFRSGSNSLLALERGELGDIRGLSLVHLQCHFGMDTLSLARMGAKVTGVDFSPAGIEAARGLAAELDLEARFVASDVCQAPAVLEGEKFDVVFTSWGVLGWLPDLTAWSQAIAGLLKPGGRFYMAEIHPVAWLFDPGGAKELREGMRQTYPYFGEGRAFTEDQPASYAAPDAQLTNVREHFWIYEIGQVLNELIAAGLRLEYLREHKASCHIGLPGMVQGADRMWRLPQDAPSLPLSFSISARG